MLIGRPASPEEQKTAEAVSKSLIGLQVVVERCMSQAEFEIVLRVCPEVPREAVVIELNDGSFLFAEHGTIYHLAEVEGLS